MGEMYEYIKDRNYKEEMDRAAAAGDMEMAAELERQRNAKIAGEGYDLSMQTHSYGNDSGGHVQNEYPATQEQIAAAKASSGTGSGAASQSYNSSYSGSGGWQSSLGGETRDLYKSILDRDPFTYDYREDPVYQQYADQYTQAGNRAMQDTLGEVSARTGGLASSYAGAAAQGSYDSYMQQLAAKVPELYQLAYSMYQNEGDNQLQNLNMLRGLQSDDRSQYNTDRAYNYGVYSDNRDFTAREAQQTKENQWYEEQVARGINEKALQAAMSNSLPQEQWEAQKEQYRKTGKGGAAVANYETYFDYMTGLTDYYAAQLK